MLPSIHRDPSLRCQARSRASGWKQCGRLRAYGSTVCQTHGARKKPRFGEDAPNYRHGRRSLEASLNDSQSLQRVRLLAVGLRSTEDSSAASRVAGEVFDKAWPILLAKQAADLERLAKIKLGRKALLPRRKRAP